MQRKGVLMPLLGVFGAMLLLSFLALPVNAAKISKDELQELKKAGERTDEELQQAAGKYNDEAQKAMVTGEGVATYGVVGYDFLTGIGKIGSSAAGTVLGDDPDALQPKFAGKRYATKWSAIGKLEKGKSGWTKETGVTEVWTRPGDETSLGADYNRWVNNWNKASREAAGGYAKDTLVAGADPNQGAHWFSFYCVHCHGWNGKGDGPTAPELDPRPRNQTNGKYMNNITNLELFAVVKGGGEARELSPMMPPWGNVMQDQDIWNVIAFLRSIANPAYATSEDEVTAANASKNQEFKDLQEMLEAEGFMAGRGGGQTGGFDSVGGGRMISKEVGVKSKPSSLENKAKGENR